MQQRDNNGVLFKNDQKQGDNHPDYKGSAMVDGVDYWLSAWINISKNGNKYMSLKLNPKEQVHNQGVQGAQQQVNQQPPQQMQQQSFDDIPF